MKGQQSNRNRRCSLSWKQPTTNIIGPAISPPQLATVTSFSSIKWKAGRSVGTVIPRNGIEIVPVPETLVQIEPEWRGFLYFV